MAFLGKYSYGLYVFHAMLSYAMLENHTLAWFERWVPQHFVAILAQAAVGIGLSVCAAWLSYHLFEKRFLALKGRYEAAKSTPAPVARYIRERSS